jgi:tripartite-type tricarboxylate transporter receptor subunit TctC
MRFIGFTKKGRNMFSRRALLATSLLPFTAQAQQDFPNKPINLVVPFAAGGSTDIIARIVGDKMSRILGQGVVIENRAGAGGNIGANSVSKATPDGYTMLMGTISTHALNSAFYKTMPYDPITGFEPISHLVDMPLVLIVSHKSGIKTVAELIEQAKKSPEAIGYASSGNGTPQHVSGELFNSMAGVKMKHIPYRGGGPALNDIVGGHVPVMFDNLPSAIEQIRGGSVRALGVTTLKRSSQLPDLPSLHELGLKGYDTYSWAILFAPPNTPKAIIDKLNKAAVEAVQDAETRKKLEQTSAVIIGSKPETVRPLVKAQLDLWLPIAKASGVSAD